MLDRHHQGGDGRQLENDAGDGVGHHTGDQLDGTDSVIVAGDDVVDLDVYKRQGGDRPPGRRLALQ